MEHLKKNAPISVVTDEQKNLHKYAETMTGQDNPCRSKQKEHTVQMESPERENSLDLMRTILYCCQRYLTNIILPSWSGQLTPDSNQMLKPGNLGKTVSFMWLMGAHHQWLIADEPVLLFLP